MPNAKCTTIEKIVCACALVRSHAHTRTHTRICAHTQACANIIYNKKFTCVYVHIMRVCKCMCV